MWSASSNGQIVGWDPVTLTAKKEVRTSTLIFCFQCGVSSGGRSTWAILLERLCMKIVLKALKVRSKKTHEVVWNFSIFLSGFLKVIQSRFTICWFCIVSLLTHPRIVGIFCLQSCGLGAVEGNERLYSIRFICFM